MFYINLSQSSPNALGANSMQKWKKASELDESLTSMWHWMQGNAGQHQHTNTQRLGGLSRIPLTDYAYICFQAVLLILCYICI